MKRTTKIILYSILGVVALGTIAGVAYDCGRESDHYTPELPSFNRDEYSGFWGNGEPKKQQDSAEVVNTQDISNVPTNSDQPISNTPTTSNEPIVPKTIIKTITNKCMFCGGMGLCRVCGGAAGRYNSYTQIYYPCTACAATSTPGRCKYCGGTGETEIIATFYPDGSAVGFDVHTGRVFNSVPGADQYLTSNEKSELRKSLIDQGNPEYMDKVVYATDYVADNRRIYCEKCGETTYRHSHIKVRIK